AGALLMQQRGFVGTTVEDVTGHLDLTKAAFYYYVENKEELLFQISTQTLALADASIAAIERSSAPPDRKLASMVDSFVRLVAERPAFFTVYFQEKGHLGADHLRSVTRVASRRRSCPRSSTRRRPRSCWRSSARRLPRSSAPSSSTRRRSRGRAIRRIRPGCFE